MTNTEIALLAGVAPAILTALFGFFAAVRKFSGTIRSSEATTLWTALEKERSNLTARLDAAYARLDVCEAKMDEMDKANNILVRANVDLNRALLDYEDRISKLTEETQVLQARVLVLQKEKAELLAKAREA